MPTKTIYYHKPFNSLCDDLKILLPEYSCQRDRWEFSARGPNIKLDGFNIEFRHKSHLVTFSYGASGIKKASHLTSMQTTELVQELVSKLQDSGKFSTVPCDQVETPCIYEKKLNKQKRKNPESETSPESSQSGAKTLKQASMDPRESKEDNTTSNSDNNINCE